VRARGALLAVATLAACHRSSAPEDMRAPAASAAAVRVAAPVPADHLAPGELLEGTDTAFDVTLPRGLHVDGRFVDLVLAGGPFSVPQLVGYFRAHVQSGDLSEGPASATFDHVTAPGHPNRPLSVHILKAGDGAHVDIRDVTPPKVAPLPDETARWKNVGLTPNGRLVDPTHLD
jgi:hypothetical protein